MTRYILVAAGGLGVRVREVHARGLELAVDVEHGAGDDGHDSRDEAKDGLQRLLVLLLLLLGRSSFALGTRLLLALAAATLGFSVFFSSVSPFSSLSRRSR